MESFLIEIPVPSMGATVNELTLIDLLVQPGTGVRKGMKLAEFESAKAVFDFESPCDGTIRGVFVRAGDVIPVGSPFLRIETCDISQKHLQAAGSPRTAAAPAAATPAPEAASAQARAGAQEAGIQWTPRARQLARESGLPESTFAAVRPTGPGGRLSGDDVERFLSGLTTAPVVRTAALPPPSASGTVCVAGIGYAVPSTVRSNEEILRQLPGRTEEEFIKLTGIRERRCAGPGETATGFAATAASHALRMAGIDPAQIDGVIVATLLPDQPVPSAASGLARHLGIKHAFAFDLNAACAGWLYGLEMGRSLILGGAARRILVVTAELLSRITNPRDPATAFLFGDGAGAAVLTDAPGGHRLSRLKLAGDSEHFDAIRRPGGGALQPVPRPGGNLDDFYLQMDGGVVFKHAVIAFADIIEDTLKRHGITAKDVTWIVPHQANERILKAVSKRVNIPYDRFVVTLGKYGNTSAASVSMAFGWAAEEGIFKDGDRIIFCAVGGGLTFAGGLLVW